MNKSFKKEKAKEELYGNPNWRGRTVYCPCVHGRHDDHRLRRRQDQHQGQRGTISVAGRQNGPVHGRVRLAGLANNIGGGSTTGLAQKAFGAWGVSAIWYVLAASLAMIPLAYFAPKIRKTMAVTIPEVVGRRFGKLSSNFTAVLSVLSLFCPDLSNRCFPALLSTR
ncbi:MAG: sodium:solute symporter family transporter [Acutalibacteraceae bacterium]